MQDIIIRKASLNDLQQLLRFEQGVIAAERPFDPTLKPGDIHYYDLEQMIASPDVEIVVAQIGEEIIGSGYACIKTSKHYLSHPKHAYLGFMYVAPDHRGKGANQKIIAYLKDWAIEKGITEMRLEVYVDNVAAIKAYEKAGFKRHMLEMRLGLAD